MGQAIYQRPDVILLDLLLPERKGLQMLGDLRQYDWAKEIPVVILTNFDESDFIGQAAALGAADYIVKSDNKLEDIVKRVDAILGQDQPEVAKSKTQKTD